MQKDIKKLLNVLMYISTRKSINDTPLQRNQINNSIPFKVNLTRKNRTKSFTLALNYKKSYRDDLNIFAGISYRYTIIDLYDCDIPHERSICNSDYYDVVLQNYRTNTQWQLSANNRRNSDIDIIDNGISFIDLDEDEYFQYSLIHDLPSYKEMLLFRELISEMEAQYNFYKNIYVNDGFKNYSKLMFAVCYRKFLRIMDSDIEVSWSMPTDEFFYKKLMDNTNFKLCELINIIENT